MNKILLFLCIFIPSLSFADCVLKQELRGQRHFLCQAPGTNKTLHVLDLKGGFSETAYFHGYFLHKEIENGMFSKGFKKSCGCLCRAFLLRN